MPRNTRSIIVLAAFVAAVAPLTSGAAAVALPGPPGPGLPGTVPGHIVAEVVPPPALADVDGDRVSDDLEGALLAAAALTPFDVVVRTASGDADAARSLTGPFAVTAELPLIDGFAATMTAAEVLALAADAETTRIERDADVALSDEGTLTDFGAAAAQADLGVTGDGVGICVIDSGADGFHEQLDNGKIVAWNDLINGLPIPYDDHSGGHGTHVAAIAAGDGVGTPIIAAQHRGVAPDADLYVVKAFPGTLDTTNPLGTTTQISRTVAGISWCVAQDGVDILSMSFALTGPSDGTDALSQAVDAAVAAGKIAIVAAGNDGPNPGLVGSPGSAASAITIGAVADWSMPLTAVSRSEGPYLPAFSSRGPTLDGRIKPDVVAPGHTVASALANSVVGYQDKSGTSMATPFAAGAAALALQADPLLGQEGLRTLMTSTAIDRGPAGQDDDWGWGMIDVLALVAEAAETSYVPTAFPTHTVLAGTTVGGTWTHTFDLTADDLSIPIAATVIIDGGPDISGAFWDPDLQVHLYDPTGLQLDFSQCPLLPDANDCLGNTAKAGRQELVHALPTTPGTYRLEVSDAAAASGGFLVDLTHGPLEGPPRAAPCSIDFTGDGDATSWADPLNWTPIRTPLPVDVVCIANGFSVVLDTILPAEISAVLLDGTLTVATANTLALTDSASPSRIAGVLVVPAGASVSTAAPLDLRGVLTGTGSVTGHVVSQGSVLPAGTAVGTLTIDGDYTQTGVGVLAVDVAGTAPTDHDLLVVTGHTAIGGTLAIQTTYLTRWNDDVEIIDAGTASGAFTHVDGAAVTAGVRWVVDADIDAPDIHLVARNDPGGGPDPDPTSGSTTVICHQPGTAAEKTKVLPAKAAESHVRSHGDRAGPCED